MRHAKIVVPRPPPHLVPRPELREMLEDQTRPADLGRVVLVSAPAGHGKTVAVADWVAATPEVPTVWVALDASDRLETRWWTAVLAALIECPAVGPESPLRRLRPAWRHPSAVERTEFLAAALNALDAVPGPVRLVLDDVHEIVGHSAFEGLLELVRHPMPSLTVVLCSRFDPPIGLDRLRLVGRLGEVRVDHLTFTTDDAAALFGQESPGLTRDEVATLVQRTEGWVAALRLAALSLRHTDDSARFVREFAGDDRSVADYLFGEVWSGLLDHEREVLEAAVVASPLPVELGAFLAGPDAPEVLEALEATTGMVTATDRLRESYRIHELLRSHVLARMRRHHPDRISALYQRATGWFDERGEHLEALRCAAHAHDVAATQTLMRARAVELMARGEFATLEQSEALTGAADDPRVRLVLGLVALESGDLDRAQSRISSAERELDADPPTEEHANLAVLRRVVALRMATTQGHLGRGLEIARSIRPDVVDGEALRAVAMVTRANGLSPTDPERARAEGERAGALIERHDWPYLRVQAESVLAVAAMYGGDLPAAARHARGAIDAALAQDFTGTMWLLRARVALAVTETLRGDTEAVRAVTAAVLADVVDGHPHMHEAFELVLGGAECDAGDRLAGWRRLRHARISSPPGMRSPFQVALASVLEQEAALRLGRIREATEVVRTATAALDGCAESALLQARLEWATGRRPVAARTMLAPALEGGVPALTVLGRIEPFLLDAEIALVRGENARAHERLGQAMAAARQLDAWRPLRDLPVDLVGFAAAQRGSFGDLDAVVDRLTATADASQPLVEALTERERAVLERLPTMRSMGEIATDLTVSLNTVKTHQRAIYHKLGVESRRDAVTRARQIGLLEPSAG